MKRHWNFPILAAHSQCFERHGKLTSESSHILYGQEQRHKHIITRSLWNQIWPSFSSKENDTRQFDYIYDVICYTVQ